MRWQWWTRRWRDRQQSAATNREVDFQNKKRGTKIMRRSVFAASLVATAVMCLSGIVAGHRSFAASAQEKPASTAEVKIDNFSFGPAAITVSVGTTVTWINRDDIPHTVVSTDKVFKSKVLDTDEKFSFTFTKPGEYPYFCSIHPKMTGEVVVQ
jgi:plastocyanin